MNEELKKCPFCGGKAQLISAKANAAGTKFVYGVHCINPKCMCIAFTRNFDNGEDAVKAWNERGETNEHL